MSQIRIVNWILTRKCNLDCDYCAIVKNYTDMPKSYPQISHYIQNEMSTKVIIDALKAFKVHNPNVFNIFYGGEPLLRPDLFEIINFCNENEIYYTIISNNTPQIQSLIKNLFDKVDYVEGFTSSVDPVFNHTYNVGKKRDERVPKLDDRISKSIIGLKRLKEMQGSGKIKDVVAEITVMNENQNFLYDLVSELSEHEIYSDITFVDIAKNPYYDFSNVTDPDQLVKPSWELSQTLSAIMTDTGLYVHMKDILIPQMFDTLPSDFDCDLELGVHNVTVDADGSMRLCLRIRGTLTPHIHVSELFESSGMVGKDFYERMCMDKRRHCKLCNHSCLMMSKHIDNHDIGEDDLVHSDKREG